MPLPIKIVALLTARPGKAEELKALLSAMRPQCRAEPGNRRWDLWLERSEPGRFVIDELFDDDAAVAAHRETPHFKKYLATINDLAERTSLLLDPVQAD